MEFLDPKKRRAHTIRLFIGYFLMAIALILTTIILVYQAYGFGIKNGEVIQNGLIFVSSRPAPAEIFINGTKHKETTNARLLIPAGQYVFELRREGYRPWKRAINVEGGTVVRFVYPVLFPEKLTTTFVAEYDVQPPLATQSPNRRWLLVQTPSSLVTFDVFDLNNPTKEPVQVTLPDNLLTLKDGLHRWKTLEWSNDNRHVLFRHSVEKNGVESSEFILLDRERPDESVNLSVLLGANPTEIRLLDKKYDRYYLYNQEDKTLSTASLSSPTPQLFLEHVLAFKSHGDDIVLYATDQSAADGKVAIKLREGDKTYTIRQVTPADTYMLNIARYSNDWYVVAGSPVENRTYVYKNPVSSLNAKPKVALVPVQVLKTPAAKDVSFSDNARFIVAQNGQHFSVYDAENDRGYAYQLQSPIDAPQTKAEWMDGHRLMAVSGGKVLVFDFDNANREVLVDALPAFRPFFDRDYKFLYTIAPRTTKADDGTETTRYALTSTSMLTPEDR